MKLKNVLAEAERVLKGMTRSKYALNVLRGRQNWSGSDLRGSARVWSASYARYRSIARSAFARAGGTVVPVEHGRMVSAVAIGADDHGNALYETRRGVYTVVPGRKRLVRVN